MLAPPPRGIDRALAKAQLTSLISAEIPAPNLLVVPTINPLVGEGGVRPDQQPSRNRVGGIDDGGARDFLVARGRESGGDHLPMIVEDEGLTRGRVMNGKGLLPWSTS